MVSARFHDDEESLVVVDAHPISDAPQRDVRIVRVDDFQSALPGDEGRSDRYARRFTTLFLQEDTLRIGGTARIGRVTNAWGEAFALKAFESDAQDTEEEIESRLEAFRRELAAYRAVSGLKGFAKLYGSGSLNGSPVLILEWIEGETLEKARRRLAIDDESRVSPLNAGRISRDAFEVLSHMDVLDDEVIHCDLSSANIMIDVSCATLEEQAEEGRFEIRIVDLGSAVVKHRSRHDDAHFPSREAGGASPLFAAPELLDDDADGVHRSADVYSAGRICQLLLAGDLSSEDSDASRISAHSRSRDIGATLTREPEVAVSVAHTLSDLAGAPGDVELQEALASVDDRLEEVIEECTASDPKRRSSATEAFMMLESFCDAYTDNIARSLRGERLVWPDRDGEDRSDLELSNRAKGNVRRTVKTLTGAIGVIALFSFVFLTVQTGLSIAWAGSMLTGIPAILSSAAALVAPSLIAFGLGRLIRGRSARFACTSLVLLLLAIVYALVLRTVVVYPGYVLPTLAADAFLAVTVPWSWSVMDRFLVTEYRQLRKRLPSAPKEIPALEGEVA